MEADNSLAKLTRTLEKTGPGAKGETLTELWRLLTTSIGSEYHAVEETILRWLLKIMNGPATKPQAEIMRRYPLTWTILEHVLSRIPLFSLAKSLADRKFIVVLQLALKNLSDSVTAPQSHEGGKRKRSHNVAYNLDALRDTDCTLDGAHALIAALTTLVNRLESRGLSTRDIMGAEHIKSLFASSAADSLGLVVPILDLASVRLSTFIDTTSSSEHWISTMSVIWNLHRIGASDAVEAATQTSSKVLQLIYRLDSRTYGSPDITEIDTATQIAWKQALEGFYTRAIIFPARTSFLMTESTEILDAVIAAIEYNALVCAPVLYTLSINAPDLNVNSIKTRESWQHQIFAAVERVLEAQYSPNKPTAMKLILDIAKDCEAGIRRESLENICRNYVLGADSTQWTVLVRVLACDRHVIFQPWGQALLADELCKRASVITTDDTCGVDDIQQVVRQVKQAYAEARDLKAFWQLWYEQLDNYELEKTSPWLDETLRYDTSATSSIESHMTPNQLSDFLQWLSAQTPIKAGPRYVLLDSATIQIRSPDFTDAAAPLIMNLTLETLSHTSAVGSINSLRWRILAKIVPWISPADRNRIWTSVKRELDSVLIRGSLDNPDAIQAFIFLDQLWSSMYPDGEHESDVSSLTLKVAKNLAKESSEKSKKPSDGDGDSTVLTPYLDLAIKTSSRLIPLLSAKSKDFPKFVRKNIIDTDSPDASTFEYVSGLILNENILNNRKLIETLIASLVSILSTSNSTAHRSSAISVLARIPDDCFSRAHRESVMKVGIVILNNKSSSHDPSLWKTALNLMNKMMKRSTFYEGISFADLVSLADSASAAYRQKKKTRSLKEVFGLDVLVSSLASAIIKQMASHFDEWGRTFLSDANKFIKACDSEVGYLQKHHLRIVLLKTLVSVVKSMTLKDREAFNTEKAEKLLLSMTKTVLVEYQADSSIGESFPYVVLAAIDASSVIQDKATETSKIKAKKLEPLAQEGVSQGTLLGWKLRAFLIRTQRDAVKDIPHTFVSGKTASEDSTHPDTLELSNYESVVHETLDAITTPLDGTALLTYLHSLINGLSSTSDSSLQLMAVNICASITGTRNDTEIEGPLSISWAYDKLLRIAITSPNGATFIKVCDILRLFLTSNSARLKQWNIEQTLSLISEVSSGAPSASAVRDSPLAYDWLCKLMEAILRRFRLRLDGRFHILITTLQSLLSGLLLTPYDARIGRWADQPVTVRDGEFTHWSKHAASFTRLLTLVCEPMAASVARHKQNATNALDTATDVAKRAAGRQMYLILVTYVKLQLQVDVPRAVRDGLELGMNSIFDITPPEVRKILNDSLDMSGRAILGTQYKRYKQFGKWSGV